MRPRAVLAGGPTGAATTSAHANRAAIRLAVLALAAVCVAGLLLLKRDANPDAIEVEQAPSAPDVILISVDTLRRDRLPIYGYERDTAPALTRFARSALVFDNAFTSSVNTAPAHATMLTGLEPLKHGLVKNRGVLSSQVATLGEVLALQGYSTAAFVSGYTMTARTGLNRGFALYDARLTRPFERPAADTAAKAAEWLRSAPAETPIFLFFHLFDPHYPYSPPEEHGRAFVPPEASLTSPSFKAFRPQQRAGLPPEELPIYAGRYDGEIRTADHHVGELLRLLAQRGRLEQSLVIFTSDHGETLQERPHSFDHGCRLFDEQIRIPLLVQLPGGARAGNRTGQTALLADLFPTVLDALGLEVPDGLDGVSLLPAARGATPTAQERPVFGIARASENRVRALDLQLERKSHVTSLRRPPFKLIAYPAVTGSVYRLFDLRDDPGEQRDVSTFQPEVLEAYRRELAPWSDALNAGASAQVVPPSAEEALRSLGYAQ